jgi:hypothetical protein
MVLEAAGRGAVRITERGRELLKENPARIDRVLLSRYPYPHSMQLRWQRLMTRHSNSQKLIDLPVLPSETRDEITLSDFASRVSIESGTLDLEALGDADISPYFQRTSILQAHRSYAELIRDDVVSAKIYPGARERVFVLLKYGDT